MAIRGVNAPKKTIRNSVHVQKFVIPHDLTLYTHKPSSPSPIYPSFTIAPEAPLSKQQLL
jgi:hypothetical protein